MKNFRNVTAKCCGMCRELKQDDVSGHYYCGLEEGGEVDFDPMEGEQWQYVCDDWAGQKGDEETMKLRVWYVKNPPRNPVHFSVDSVEQAIVKINETTKRDLEDPCAIDNAFGLEICEEGDWTEYYDEKGKDILEIIEKIEKRKNKK